MVADHSTPTVESSQDKIRIVSGVVKISDLNIEGLQQCLKPEGWEVRGPQEQCCSILVVECLPCHLVCAEATE